MADDRKRTRVVAHGNVQGVFFRDSVRQRAQSLGLAGWARNKADGSMEALFEGPANAVDQAVAFCNDGPEKARVNRLDEIEEEPQGISGFRVK
ncbi:MAG: acylphosphatase [Solirubrobacterales bacterium]